MFATTKTPLKFAAALAVSAMAMIAGTASADTFESNGRTMAVRYGDLDLSQQAGQEMLDKRIGRAATKVCDGYTDSRAAAKCRTIAIANVKAPIASAIAKANSRERYADASSKGTIAIGQ